MHELKLLWLDQDKINVKEAIIGLLNSVGYRASDDTKKDMAEQFTTDLQDTNLPPPAILRALHTLKFDDIQRVSLYTIITEAKKYVEPETRESADCDWCDGRGIVMMRNPDKYQFSLACKCSNGDAFAKQGNKRWNGEQFQQGRHGLYEFEHYDLRLKASKEPKEQLT